MKVLVIGSGGREHAIVSRLKQSPSVTKLYCAPGNPGMRQKAQIVDIKADNLEGLLNFAKSEGIDLTVVGPELPLALGLVDLFRANGLKIFGAPKESAHLESSKAFAKEVMVEAGVPTARYEVLHSKPEFGEFIKRHPCPVVLKADGLAAGKGVHVCHFPEEVQEGLRALFDDLKADQVVVEQFLEGIEASFIVATDGEVIVPMMPSHDYKRIFDNDGGPNTGGMGTVCPTPRLSAEQADRAINAVIIPTLKEMERRGTPFSGFLYAGLMIAPNGEFSVLEFNTRLGDPETQSIMQMMESDFAQCLMALAQPKSGVTQYRVASLQWRAGATVSLVLAAAGYPTAPQMGDEITGINLAESISNVAVFHAGTKLSADGKLVTSGGRVLNVSATADSLERARSLAYKAADMIQFRGRQMRRDIGIR